MAAFGVLLLLAGTSCGQSDARLSDAISSPNTENAQAVRPMNAADAEQDRSPTVSELSGLPSRYREQYTNYVRVGRTDGTIRHMYMQEQIYESMRQRDTFPPGVIIIMESYSAERSEDRAVRIANGEIVAGTLHNVFVMQKSARSHNEVDYPAEQWNYYWFRGDGRLLTTDATSCLACHGATPDTDSVFTFTDMRSSHTTGNYAYRVCDLPGRQPCPPHFAPGSVDRAPDGDALDAVDY